MSLLQKGSKENYEVIGAQGVGCCVFLGGVRFGGVPSTFWAVFLDGGGVLVCAVHVLGGFCGREWCFGVSCSCLGGELPGGSCVLVASN